MASLKIKANFQQKLSLKTQYTEFLIDLASKTRLILVKYKLFNDKCPIKNFVSLVGKSLKLVHICPEDHILPMCALKGWGGETKDHLGVIVVLEGLICPGRDHYPFKVMWRPSPQMLNLSFSDTFPVSPPANPRHCLHANTHSSSEPVGCKIKKRSFFL